MKKLLIICILMVSILFISGCTSDEQTSSDISTSSQSNQQSDTQNPELIIKNIKIQEKLETPEGVIVKIELVKGEYSSFEYEGVVYEEFGPDELVGVIENPTNIDLENLDFGMLVKHIDESYLDKKYIWDEYGQGNSLLFLQPGRSKKMNVGWVNSLLSKDDTISEIKPFVKWVEDTNSVKVYPPCFNEDPRRQCYDDIWKQGGYIKEPKNSAYSKHPKYIDYSNLKTSQDSIPTPTGTPISTPAPTQQSEKITVSADDDPVKGSNDASVTMIEFSDYECSFCARYYVQTFPHINENYIQTGKVKLIFRDYPLGFHQNAKKAAEASECADEQGKYWEYHNTLFENQNALDIESLKQYAINKGLDETEFNQCLDSGIMASEVEKDFQDGVSYGISGTPTFFINGIKVVGAQPYEVFQQIIDQELKT